MKFIAVSLAALAAILIGCSGGDFDVAETQPDPSADSGIADAPLAESDGKIDETNVDSGTGSETSPDTKTPSDTGIALDADIGVDTGIVTTDSGVIVDTGSDTGSPTDSGGADASEVGTDGGDAGDAAKPIVCVPRTRDMTTSVETGDTRCTGAQPEYCNAEGTGWLPIAGACTYGVCVVDPAKGAACACEDTTGRFKKVSDSMSPDGFAVKDTKTGLTWADSNYSLDPMSPSFDYMGWSQAKNGCEYTYGSGFGGGWRLPTRAEYEAVVTQLPGSGPWGSTPTVRTTCLPGAPDFDPILSFKSPVGTEEYWTSDMDATSTKAYVIRIFTGVFRALAVTPGVNAARARCVHD
jgi:hypothetical protein